MEASEQVADPIRNACLPMEFYIDFKRSPALSKWRSAACAISRLRGKAMITRNGKSVVRKKGLDREQIELGSSDKFWKLISKRRKEKALSRADLERKIKSRK